MLVLQLAWTQRPRPVPRQHERLDSRRRSHLELHVRVAPNCGPDCLIARSYAYLPIQCDDTSDEQLRFDCRCNVCTLGAYHCGLSISHSLSLSLDIYMYMIFFMHYLCVFVPLSLI